jgi:S-(hydroxymethyl)glutathione dehydrogenase/alcohol dehydrogenase
VVIWVSTQGKRRDAGWHVAFRDKGKNGLSLHGHADVSEYTVVPEIAVDRINSAAPLKKVCLLGCGITTGIGAVLNTAKGRPGSTAAVFALPAPV